MVNDAESKQNNPLVSVIVPVYKVEQYLPTCLDSICGQTYCNLEIILVDDGSPDRCGQICDDYAATDERIRVIHKGNGGLSEARNYGLAAASGEFITFVDSDDWIRQDCINRLVQLAKEYNADISVCNFENANKENMPKSNDNSGIFAFLHSGINNTIDLLKKLFQHRRTEGSEGGTVLLDHDEAVLAWLYHRYYGVSACGKLYSSNCMQDICFPVGKLHEDVGTTYKMFLRADKVVYTNEKLYSYRRRTESIINRPFDTGRLDYLEFTREIMNLMEEEYPEYYQAAVSRHFQGCVQIGCAQKRPDQELLDEIHQYAYSVNKDKKCRGVYKLLAKCAILSPHAAVQLAKTAMYFKR